MGASSVSGEYDSEGKVDKVDFGRREKERERAFASRVIVWGTFWVKGRRTETRDLVACKTLCQGGSRQFLILKSRELRVPA